MFKQMENIDKAFRQFRFFTLIVVTGSISLSVFVVYKSYRLIAAQEAKVYILANGKVLEAYASDRKDNIIVEAKDHVKSFHHYFFTLDPDEKVIQANITKALYLADASAKRVYDNLKENGYYSNIISGNVSQEIAVDSVQVELDI